MKGGVEEGVKEGGKRGGEGREEVGECREGGCQSRQDRSRRLHD